MEKRFYKLDRTFPLECGEKIENLEICYHISKDFTADAGEKKVVWITHALTANSDPTDWWDVLVGEGKFFDPRKYTIVCANILGSCYGSTSPCSINPATGKQCPPQVSSSECSPGHFPGVGREIWVLITRFPPIQHLLAAGPRVEISDDDSLRGPCPAIAPSLIPDPVSHNPLPFSLPSSAAPIFLTSAQLTWLRISQVSHSQPSQFQPTGAWVYSGRITSGLSSRRFWIG